MPSSKQQQPSEKSYLLRARPPPRMVTIVSFLPQGFERASQYCSATRPIRRRRDNPFLPRRTNAQVMVGLRESAGTDTTIGGGRKIKNASTRGHPQHPRSTLVTHENSPERSTSKRDKIKTSSGSKNPEPHLPKRVPLALIPHTFCSHVLPPAEAAVESTAQDALQGPDEVVSRDRTACSLRATRRQIIKQLVPRGALPLGRGCAFGILEGVQLLRDQNKRGCTHRCAHVRSIAAVCVCWPTHTGW